MHVHGCSFCLPLLAVSPPTCTSVHALHACDFLPRRAMPPPPPAHTLVRTLLAYVCQPRRAMRSAEFLLPPPAHTLVRTLLAYVC